MLSTITGIISIVQQLSTLAGDLAQKEAFTDEQKTDIEQRLAASRARLDDLLAKVEADPE